MNENIQRDIDLYLDLLLTDINLKKSKETIGHWIIIIHNDKFNVVENDEGTLETALNDFIEVKVYGNYDLSPDNKFKEDIIDFQGFIGTGILNNFDNMSLEDILSYFFNVSCFFPIGGRIENTMSYRLKSFFEVNLSKKGEKDFERELKDILKVIKGSYKIFKKKLEKVLDKKFID